MAFQLRPENQSASSAKGSCVAQSDIFGLPVGSAILESSPRLQSATLLEPVRGLLNAFSHGDISTYYDVICDQ